MNFNKEQLAEVNGLHLSSILNDMNGNQFDEYTKALISFTEGFPSQEIELKQFFNTKDYDNFSKVLISVQSILEKIQAIDLVQSCFKLQDEIKTERHDIAEAHLTYLLVEITALSIDIQLAQHTLETPGKTDEKMKSDISDNESEEVVQKSILAVDDVTFQLRTLKSLLQNTKYKLMGVTSGENALRYLEKHEPDLFMLDIEMPNMNGYELAKKIRSSGQKAPIIFLTGNAEQKYVLNAIKAGGVDFIVKPINKNQVLEKIKKHIG